MIATIDDILTLWFAKGMSRNWFGGGDTFDALITDRFSATLDAASTSQLEGWKDTVEGRLALVIVLDQFSKNIHRGNAGMYANDIAALDVANHALRMGDDLWLKNYRPADWRIFLYLPFMHSEAVDDQRRCLELYLMHGPDHGIGHARHHLDIITRFGRFPHRNTILGRKSTTEEMIFLKTTEGAV